LLPIAFSSLAITVADAGVWYMGFPGSQIQPGAGTGASQLHKVYIRRAGVIRVAEMFWNGSTGAGSNENISIYVRLNDTTDTLIATVGDTNAQKVFSNTAIDITVAQGDYIECKVVAPIWATNPTQVYISGYLLVE
jgi:hypothetical protein